MNGYEEAVALAASWRASGIERCWNGSTHCIEATKIGIAVLRRVGVEARPLPCGITVANAEAQRLIEREVPISEWPDSAWSVGVNPDVRNGGNGWDGHLIIEGDGWVSDLAGAQFARRVIRCAAWASPTPDDWTGAEPFTITNGDTVARIFPRRELARWRNGSAWRQETPEHWMETLLRGMDRLETSS